MREKFFKVREKSGNCFILNKGKIYILMKSHGKLKKFNTVELFPFITVILPLSCINEEGKFVENILVFINGWKGQL